MTRATRTMLTLVSAVLLLAIGLAAQKTDSAQALLRAATDKATVDGDLNAAITQYQAIVDQYAKTDHGAAATALLRMAEAHQKLGDARATTVYERLVRDYGDQREQVAVARGRLAALQPSARSQTTQVARQIWAGNVSMGGGGRPSPDGRYLSFTERETGDLAVRDLITNTSRHVTNTGGWVASGDYATGSVISPDGRQVAYEWFVQKEFKNELRVASIATDELVHPRVVLRTERNDYLRHLAWTPDGKQLIVLRSLPDRINQIGIITIQDVSFRNIKSLEWRDSDLRSLSPDGRYVAYDVPPGEAGSPRDIFVLATDGSRETAVVKSPASDSSPLWSSDGSQLLFLSDRTGSNALWAVPIQDGRPNGPAASIKTDVGVGTSLMGMTSS